MNLRLNQVKAKPAKELLCRELDFHYFAYKLKQLDDLCWLAEIVLRIF